MLCGGRKPKKKKKKHAGPLRGGGCGASKQGGGADTPSQGGPPSAQPQQPIKTMFLPEAPLRELGRIPRRGSNADFVHPITGRPNDNIHLPFASFDASKTCFVFVSHRWIRPGMGAAGLPDDDSNSKFKLILAALDRLRGPNAPVPENFQFAVWLDFGCIDQACAARPPAGTLFFLRLASAAFFSEPA